MERVFNSEEQLKLKSIVKEGLEILGKVEVLKGGLDDAIKAIAEELEIKPADLKKAINVAHKNSFHKAKDSYDTLETILEIVGHTE